MYRYLGIDLIGPKSAEQLSVYLRSETCPLRRLILQHADVDDGECQQFVETLKNNKSLTEIDLSSNKIGESMSQRGTGKGKTILSSLYHHLLMDIYPSVDSENSDNGVDAIAQLLTGKDCRLKVLKLSWNMIRLSGGVNIALSLQSNCSLTLLDLSFNTLGRNGGIALGKLHSFTIIAVKSSGSICDCLISIPLSFRPSSTDEYIVANVTYREQ